MLRYKLDDLGWYQFEPLIQSLLKAEISLAIESWGGPSDMGRDAYYEGKLDFPEKDSSGSYVFQVKFVENANAAGSNPYPSLKKSVNREMVAIKKRQYTEEFNLDFYTFITNVALTGKMRKDIIGIIQQELPSCKIITRGGQDVCDDLDRNPNIRQSFPQLLGLRDIRRLLNQVVAKPILERSTLLIDYAKEAAEVFVPTSTYGEALQKLCKNNFLVLVGPPEVGKTTIARIIGLTQLLFGNEVFECRNPDEFHQMYDAKSKQLFIADDAFGATEYDPTKCHAWGYDLHYIIHRLNKNHRFIWTTRTHILNIALKKLRRQQKAENFPAPADVLVDATKLKETEKAIILYRHAKAKNLDKLAKMIIKTHAETIVKNPNFTPERIRRLVQTRLDKYKDLPEELINKKELEIKLNEEVNEPSESMNQAFKCLPRSHMQFLLCMLDCYIPNTSEELQKKYNLYVIEENLRPFMEVKIDLTDTFIKISKEVYLRNKEFVNWVHPSLKDVVVNCLKDDLGKRVKFFERCGLRGLQLALSVNEESKNLGTLIIDESDYQILQEKVFKACIEMTENEIEDLLKIVDNMFAYYKEDYIKQKPFLEILPAFITKVMNLIRNQWDTRNTIINNYPLMIFYKLVNKLQNERQLPNLVSTWNQIHKELIAYNSSLAKSDFMEFELLDDYSIVKQFLEFIYLVSENDPSFLQSIDFPRVCENEITQFLSHCQKLADEDVNDFLQDDPDLIESDVEKLHDFSNTLLQYTDTLPQYADSFNDIAEKIDTNAYTLSEISSDIYAEPDRDYSEYETSGIKESSNIQAIFSDL